MQQPLVHLYFLTIFEDLLGSEFNLSALIKTSQSISKVIFSIVMVCCMSYMNYIYLHACMAGFIHT